MPQHWEFNMFNTTNRPQAWGVDMKRIWKVGILLFHGRINMMNDNMTNP